MAPVESMFKHHFLRGAGLHAAGAGDHFGADFGHDGEVGSFGELRTSIAGDGDGFGSASPGVLDGGNGERSASAGGDADDYVVLAGLLLGDFAFAQLAGIFVALDRRP